MTPTTRHWLEMTESIIGHAAAIVLGLVMMIIGLGLGVTMIMLPVGVVIGLLGAGLFVTGIFGHFSSGT